MPHLWKDLVVFTTKESTQLDSLSVTRVRAPLRTQNEYLRAFWEQALVPSQVRHSRIEVFHSPNYILPLALRCPTVVTVHDLAFLDSSLHTTKTRIYLSVLTAAAVRKADAVICVSEYTRDRLVEWLPSLDTRIRVIGEGVAAQFVPAGGDEIRSVRREWGLFRPYVLFVGTIEPRKNIARLIRAFRDAVSDGNLPHQLVLIGDRGWKNDEVWSLVRSTIVQDRIRYLGYVPDALLPAMYSGADVLAYLPTSEGFGLPPLEAMACGTAVLTSCAASLPAVVDDAAMLVDPNDDDAVAGGLVSMITDDALRASYAARGLERAREFSWESVARQTLALYRQVMP
jgi:glycosyltransferase involved in cell wall biosynthesis